MQGMLAMWTDVIPAQAGTQVCIEFSGFRRALAWLAEPE